MPTYTNTAKYLLRKLTGSNLISDIDAGIAALADDVDAKFAGYSSGPLASRPVSTGGTPGIAGRRYRATDTLQTFEDTGTGWIEVAEAPVAYSKIDTAAKQTLMAPGRTLGEISVIMKEGDNWSATASGSRTERHDSTGVGQLAGGSSTMPMITFRASDYAISGLATKLRLRMSLVSNTGALTLTFTGKLWKITSSGASTGTFVGVAAAAVSGASVQIASPGGSAAAVAVSAPFDPPVDGIYALAIDSGGVAMPTTQAAMMALALELAYV